MTCPICGCDSHMEEDMQDLEFCDELLIQTVYINCRNCESSFSITYRYKTESLDCEGKILDEQHEDNSGEANYKEEENDG